MVQIICFDRRERFLFLTRLPSFDCVPVTDSVGSVRFSPLFEIKNSKLICSEHPEAIFYSIRGLPRNCLPSVVRSYDISRQ